jgi:protein disulfide-isomerase
MKKLLLPLLAVALCATADEPVVPFTGAELGVWTQDYVAATNAAATDGKPVLLDFTGSDWCGWCMLMENKVFCTQEWEDWAASNIYLVTLDFPRDESKVPEDYQKRNRELSKQYGVRGYPTYIVLDSKGQKLGQLGADRNAKPGKFIRQLCGVLGIDPPANANAAPADPAAKRLVDSIAAALKATEQEAEALENPTAAQYTAVNEHFSAAIAAIDTKDVPEILLAAFKSFSDAFATMTAEFKKLDQTKTLRELGAPPASLQAAMAAAEKAVEKLADAAEACGIEDAADLLDF